MWVWWEGEMWGGEEEVYEGVSVWRKGVWGRQWCVVGRDWGLGRQLVLGGLGCKRLVRRWR